MDHVLVYSLILFIFGLQVLVFDNNFKITLFVVVNFFAHFCTDFVTSRISSYYYAKEERHNFFVTIGADQAIHMVTLYLTAWFCL